MTVQPVRGQQQAFFHLLPQRHVGIVQPRQVIIHHIDREGCQWGPAIAFCLRGTGDGLPQRMAAQSVTLR
ncbi:hypothetical protein ExPCM12_04436 [Escherichia coli]|nr:hypothetical protein ExPCM12_04436 [Escherichia coli]